MIIITAALQLTTFMHSSMQGLFTGLETQLSASAVMNPVFEAMSVLILELEYTQSREVSHVVLQCSCRCLNLVLYP